MEPIREVEKQSPLEDKIEVLIAAVTAGMNIMTACHYSGISSTAVYGWMERGRLEEDRLEMNARLKPKKSEEGCLQIWQDLKKANAVSISTMEAAIIRSAKEGEWKAAAWWLERRQPDTYGKSASERKPQNLSPNRELE